MVVDRVTECLRVSVDFKNAPSWVKTSSDHNGLFKEFKVNRGFAMPMASDTN
jgi:hypothetical protein